MLMRQRLFVDVPAYLMNTFQRGFRAILWMFLSIAAIGLALYCTIAALFIMCITR